MFTPSSLQTLRERVDLIEVLSGHIDLKRAGATYKALCPFHDEKSPSFMVKRGDTHYHCFGCGAHGDAIQFLINHLGLSFREAVEMLAEQFHVALEKTEQKERGTSTVVLKEVLNFASLFYHFYLLHTEEGKGALNYLFKRGLSLEFLEKFQVGYAPASSELFFKATEEKKFSRAVVQECGLLSHGRPFFRERITFPIRDPRGQVIGFSARKMREEVFGGKYINSPETQLFKKSRLLFGLNYSRKRMAKEHKAILVEGQIDCLRLIDQGYDFTVATLGTAFTMDHVQEIKRLGVTLVTFLFDADEAGEKAASKAGDLFQKEGIAVRVGRLPKGSDPDTFVRERGEGALNQVLQEAIDYLAYQIYFLSHTFDMKQPADKAALVRQIKEQIEKWTDPVMRHESLKRLSELTKVPEETLGIKKSYAPTYFSGKVGVAGLEVDPNRVMELDLLRWLVLMGDEKKEFVEKAEKYLSEAHFLTPVCRALFIAYLKAEKGGAAKDFLSLLVDLDPEEGERCFEEILKKKINKERAESGFIASLQKLIDRDFLHKREMIKREIHSGTHSDEEMLELVKQFDALKKTDLL